MDVKNVCSLFFFVVFFCSSCFSQDKRHDFSPVVKVITSTGGSGSGFIVAENDGLCEVWTNAHVAGVEGEIVSIRFFKGGTKQGIVSWSKLDRERGLDAAKVVVSIPDDFVVDPFFVGRSSSENNFGVIDGWPLGRWQVGKPIVPDQNSTRFGTAYQPISHKGESGSPVTDSDTGKVIGVATWTFGPPKRPLFSVFQPIEHWTGEGRSIEMSHVDNLNPIGLHFKK